MKNQKGFSLIELLIVVAIIGIIAAIAIPSLIKARAAANESSAIGTLRTFGSAEATAMSRNGNISLDMAGLSNGGYIDEALAAEGSIRNSYVFNTVTSGSTDFEFSAAPDPASLTAGDRSFNIYSDFVIRFANSTTPPTGTTGSVLGSA